MQLIINSEPAEYPDEITVVQLLEQLNLTNRPVAVERNRDIVPFRTFGEAVLHNGDVLEVVTLVPGG
jgi:thiamine biosynthesis protein ThiS